MAVGEHRYIGADGRPLGYSNKHAVGPNRYLVLLEHNFIESPSSVLHRRSALSITGVFDESLRGAEDYELYLRIARQGDFIIHEAAVSEYRLHGFSLPRDAVQMMLATYRVLQMELSYLRGDWMKLRHHYRGVKFCQRHFGRRLTRELIRGQWIAIPEAPRRLRVLRVTIPWALLP
jgi:GT2 family glycosyltransferase